MIEPRQQYKANGYQFQLQTYGMLPTTEAGTIRCKAIYVDDRDAGDVNIEVLVMDLGKPHHLSESQEFLFRLPGNNSWGSYAWSFRDMTAAIRKFERI